MRSCSGHKHKVEPCDSISITR